MGELLSKLAYYGGKPSVTRSLNCQWPQMALSHLEETEDLLHRGILSCYEEGLDVITRLEKKLKLISGAKHALYVNSGTSALLLAFYAANLSFGDEVIVPAYTYPATITPLFHFGVKIVLADIEEDSYNISVDAIKRNVTDKTKMVVVTHMRGLPVDMEPLSKFCKSRGIFLVEDASHAIGATYQGIHVGNWGDCGCFSLSADKLVSGGTAGFLVTNDDRIYQKVHAAINGPGREGGMDFSIENYCTDDLKGIVETGIGFNFKSSPITAAIIAAQLDLLEESIKARQNNLLGLTEMLKKSHGIIPPKERMNSRGGWYGYRPFYDKQAFKGLKKEAFINLMKAEGAEVSGSGIKPFYKYPVVQFPELQKIVSFGRMGGDMFRFDIAGFRNVEINNLRTLKFPVSNSRDALEVYAQYVNAINKIYSCIDVLPKEIFE